MDELDPESEGLDDVRLPRLLIVCWLLTGSSVVLSCSHLLLSVYASGMYYDDARLYWSVVGIVAAMAAVNVVGGTLLPAVTMLRGKVFWQQGAALASSAAGGTALLFAGAATASSYVMYHQAWIETTWVEGRPTIIDGRRRRAEAVRRTGWSESSARS